MVCIFFSLVRYLYPTDNELRNLAGVIKEKQKGKKDRKYHENGISTNSTFHVPRNLDFQVNISLVSVFVQKLLFMCIFFNYYVLAG